MSRHSLGVKFVANHLLATSPPPGCASSRARQTSRTVLMSATCEHSTRYERMSAPVAVLTTTVTQAPCFAPPAPVPAAFSLPEGTARDSLTLAASRSRPSSRSRPFRRACRWRAEARVGETGCGLGGADGGRLGAIESERGCRLAPVSSCSGRSLRGVCERRGTTTGAGGAVVAYERKADGPARPEHARREESSLVKARARVWAEQTHPTPQRRQKAGGDAADESGPEREDGRVVVSEAPIYACISYK